MRNPDKIKELLHTIATVYPNHSIPWVFQKTTAEAAKDALSYIRELEKRLADVNASPFDGGMSQAEHFEPVKHGEWIPFRRDIFNIEYFRCSVCGKKEKHGHWAYCHCGAKMDGKGRR